jgi:hypothetical protein
MWGHSWSTEGWFYKTCGRCGEQQQFYGHEARERTRKYEAKLRRRARSPQP